MSLRKKYDERCTRCFMKHDLCLCAVIPTIHMSTKLIVIVGKRESTVPTNTGRLAALAIPECVTLIRGDPDRPYDLAEHLPEGNHHMLLYPSPDAEVLTPEYVETIKRPMTLVVPDGNWRQANKMRRRDPVMLGLPVVKIPPGTATQYKVRKESQAEGLATIEAIARALGVIESKQVQEQLETLFTVMVTRILASRGVKMPLGG